MKNKIILGVSLLACTILLAQPLTQIKAGFEDSNQKSKKDTIASTKNKVQLTDTLKISTKAIKDSLIDSISLKSDSLSKKIRKTRETASYLYLGGGVGYNQLKTDLSNGIQEPILGYSGNLNYSYFFSKNFGLQTGLGVQTFGSLVSMTGNSSLTLQDGSGNDYSFITTTNQYEEKQTTLMLEVPLMFQYRQPLNKNWGLVFSVGGVFGYPYKSSYTTTGKGTLNTSGQWADLNLNIDDLPVHGFGSHADIYQADLKFKPSVMGVVDLGGLFKTSDNSELYLGAYVNYGFNNILTLDTKQLMTPQNIYNGVLATSNVTKVAPFAVGVKLGIYLNVAKKDTDKDGVPDKKDKCPDTPTAAFGMIDLFGCPLDTDGDSIPDYLDKCPSTPKEAFGKIDSLGCPLDTDGDSIPDYLDKCPDTPKEAFGKIDSLGCPLDTDGDSIPDYLDKCPDTPKEAFGKIDSLGCPIDSDKDGIADYLDKCPKTPKAAIGFVNKDGCPMDSDGDGILDYLDKCPNVPGSSSNNGCPEVKKEVTALFKKALQGIQFESGNSKIKPASYALLNQIAETLIKNPTYLVEINGHTDNVGNPESNMKLSQDRAESVRKYLIFAGVAEKRLTSKGFGDTNPVSTNATAAGRTLNRRVEFVVTFEAVIN